MGRLIAARPRRREALGHLADMPVGFDQLGHELRRQSWPAGFEVIPLIRASLDIADPAFLVSTASYLAAYSTTSGHAFVFDTVGDHFSLIEHKQYPRDILSLTLSPQARFAVVTPETIEQQGYSILVPIRKVF